MSILKFEGSLLKLFNCNFYPSQVESLLTVIKGEVNTFTILSPVSYYERKTFLLKGNQIAIVYSSSLYYKGCI